MDSLISRQDAIDALEEYEKRIETAEQLWTIRSCKDEILKLPSAQQWIPCSERLPENDEIVLATTAWGEVTIAERIYPPINDTCWFINDGNTNATIDDVVAWMPLPEPAYMEETNGKDV